MSVFILGGGQTDFARDYHAENLDFTDLIRDSVRDAMDAAKIPPEEIRRLVKEDRFAVFFANFSGQQFLQQGHLGSFLTLVDDCFIGAPSGRYEAACASGGIALEQAAARIRGGDFDLVLVAGMEMMRHVPPQTGNEYLGSAAFFSEEAAGVRFPFPVMFGSIAEELIQRQTQVGEERILACFDRISEINRQNAVRNPLAQTRQNPLARRQLSAINEKYRKAFGGRTRYSDCSQITDGACSLFMASSGYAADHRKKTGVPLSVLTGWGHVTSPLQLKKKLSSPANEPFFPWAGMAVSKALHRASLRAEQLDVMETHDCFTVSEYMAISAFQITETGNEYRAIEEDRISLDGDKPVNPSGGLIGCGHPVGATGIRMALDLHRQMTGNAGEYQVEGAKNGAMLNIGGNFTTCLSLVISGT